MVKCAECGFLAARNKETRKLEEVEFESRQNGYLKANRYEYIPVCFAMVISFDKECEELRKLPQYQSRFDEIGGHIYPNTGDLIIPLLSKERDCESFIEWIQGFTPREHQEMLDRGRMLKWQADREDADRKWRTSQQWFMVIVAGIFTVIGGICGAVIALIASGQLASLFPR